ncbi:endonuclease/exonuclease/phosphatase family protein [Nonomuraea sp. NPDC050540]|uniref:endonuclease/exonuclease/phosphatase family protein n=1 Tax=Nonomuraea sp. NPDC050540 TaxID=3364367 RepID=UPI0037B09EC8
MFTHAGAAAVAAILLMAPSLAPTPEPTSTTTEAETSGKRSIRNVESAPPRPIRVLQMNLCNSGLARHCWDKKPGAPQNRAGATMQVAAAEIARIKPTAVTINEICSGDLEGFKQKIGFKGDSFFTVLEGAPGSRTPKKCGQPGKPSKGGDYGSAILTKEPLREPYSEFRLEKAFDTQRNDREVRVMGCRKMPWATVCTAQLHAVPSQESDEDYLRSVQVTADQCFQLSREARRFAGDGPLIIAGDLNLRWNKPHEQNALNLCGKGLIRKGDGNRQHVISGKTFGEPQTEPWPDTSEPDTVWTDHPLFYVDLT